MSKLSEFVDNYINNSTPEDVRKDWEELKMYNNGPDIMEVLSGNRSILFSSDRPFYAREDGILREIRPAN